MAATVQRHPSPSVKRDRRDAAGIAHGGDLAAIVYRCDSLFDADDFPSHGD